MSKVKDSQSATKIGPEASRCIPPKAKHDVVRTLLANKDQTVDDKVATVKTAHQLDKERFETAFRTFMSTTNS